MKKITKTFNVYSLKELKDVNKEKYEKECEDIRDIIINDNFYYFDSDLDINFKDDYKLEGLKFGYSLSFSQGDGFCFYYKNNENILSYTRLKNNKQDELNVFEKYIIENYKENLKTILKFLNYGYSITIKKSCSNYEHSRTCEIDYDYSDELTTQELVIIDNLVKDLYENVYLDICSKYEDMGYKCYEVSEEDIFEYAEINDLEFEILANEEN